MINNGNIFSSYNGKLSFHTNSPIEGQLEKFNVFYQFYTILTVIFPNSKRSQWQAVLVIIVGDYQAGF